MPQTNTQFQSLNNPDAAQQVQGEVLVQLNTAPAHGIATDDRLI